MLTPATLDKLLMLYSKLFQLLVLLEPENSTSQVCCVETLVGWITAAIAVQLAVCEVVHVIDTYPLVTVFSLQRPLKVEPV
jgi:hypothetical protein